MVKKSAIKKSAFRGESRSFYVGISYLFSSLVGLNVDEFTSFLAGGEHNHTVDQCEKCVVLTHADIQSGMVYCSTLTLQDVASLAVRATKNLHSESFAL